MLSIDEAIAREREIAEQLKAGVKNEIRRNY